MKYPGFLLSLLLLIGCAEDNQKESPSRAIGEYYNIDSLLTQQINTLTADKARLVKKVMYSGKEEEDTIVLTRESLEQELQLFNEMNINKPSLAGRYIKTEQDSAGITITRYQADEPEELRVNYLKVYRRRAQVQRLEALFSDRNLLYNSTRKLMLNLNQQ